MSDFPSKLSELCLKLFEIDVLKFGDFKMKVGLNSPVYFDLRSIISYPHIMNDLTDLLTEFISLKSSKPKLLCGVPYTALPIATVISVKAKVPMVVRRKEKKSYGTMKLIEGRFNSGDEVTIIEDVVTSGSSIIETVNDLKNDGLVVKEAFVILDREQGGTANLSDCGIKMHSLLTCSQLLNILHNHGKVKQEMIDKVHKYISEHQITASGNPRTKLEARLGMSFGSRAELAKCTMAKVIFQLMEKKKSNLCIAVDVQTKEELISLVKKVGEHACIIKTHYDAIADWDTAVEKQLQELAEQMNFIIMEDRKLGDIGRTVLLQSCNIFRWAQLCTVHGIGGIGSITGISQASASSGNRPLGIFLIAELSSKGNLITPQYTKATVELGKEEEGLVAGMVCQSADLVSHPGLIQMTPGVSLVRGGDDLGQKYVGLEESILTLGADLVVVGRAITQANDPAAVSLSVKKTLWDAYLKRTSN